MSSASLNDPSTGDFDLELPSGAVESVEVLSNPFAAEYGRFSTSVTQVRTKRGTNEWVVKPDNLVPGFGKGFAFVNKFEPRLSISGPLKRDRLLLGQYLQYRFVRTPVKSLPGEPAARARQLRLVHAARRGAVVAPRADRRRDLLPAQDHQRHAVDVPAAGDDAEVHAGGLLGRPRRSADSVGAGGARVDARRRACSRSTRRPRATAPMVYAPQGQSGNFFNRQERNVQQPAARRGADGLEGRLGRPARVQVRPRPAALGLRRRQLQPAGRRAAPRRLAGRAHHLRAAARRTPTSAAPSSPCSCRIAGASTIG